MSRLRVYAWERQTYPAFRTVQLCSEDARKYVRKLARHFKLLPPRVVVGGLRSYNGRYHPQFFGEATIKLHATIRGSNLGTLCHEFAHHLDHCHYHGRGHTRTFKRSLKRVYTWAKRWLPQEAQ